MDSHCPLMPTLGGQNAKVHGTCSECHERKKSEVNVDLSQAIF